MTWHLFMLIWGRPFIEQAERCVIPFLAMPGNIPALAKDDAVTLHVYTDEGSRPGLAAALAPLASWCAIDIRLFDDTRARHITGPDYRYELQRLCLQDLARSFNGDPLILLDSNLLLADGTLAALAARRRIGARAVAISLLRARPEPLTSRLAPMLARKDAIGARRLVEATLGSLHHITESFFVDATPFTPYPSQMSWRVGDDGFVTRAFLPHPFMVPISPALARYQSSMDYDLTLRAVSDNELYMVSDSDEMLAVKVTGDEHQAQRADGGFSPNAADLGLFLLTCTNHRHRAFADTPVVFHRGERDARFEAAVAASQQMVDAAYGWIDALAARAGQLDARLLMYLKSHLGPIEDFMSPQLEPAALGRLD